MNKTLQENTSLYYIFLIYNTFHEHGNKRFIDKVRTDSLIKVLSNLFMIYQLIFANLFVLANISNYIEKQKYS